MENEFKNKILISKIITNIGFSIMTDKKVIKKN